MIEEVKILTQKVYGKRTFNTCGFPARYRIFPETTIPFAKMETRNSRKPFFHHCQDSKTWVSYYINTNEMSTPVINTAVEFYSELKRKGLHLRKGNGRDNGLLKELMEKLGCPDNNFQHFLKRSNMPAERFLVTFLTVAQPFAKMFEEIWKYLSKKAAPLSSENISVRFGLPPTEPTTLDLEAFRRYVDSFKSVSARIKLLTWPEAELKKLFELSQILEDTPFKDNWREYQRYYPGENYLMPAIRVSSQAIDAVVQNIRNVFQNIIEDYNQAEATRKNMNRSIQEFEGAEEQNKTYGQLRSQAVLLTDLLPRWYLIFLHLDQVSPRKKEEAFSFFQKNIKPGLINEEKEGKAMVQEALDILDLPFWKYRWHTYEIWSAVMTIASLEDYQPVPIVKNGRIAFDSSAPEIIARLNVNNYPAACIAIQIETPFTGEPKRKAIRPDLRICYSSEVGEIDQTAAVIECKQRELIDRFHVEEVSRSYTGGAPNSSGTIIINYDEPALHPVLAPKSHFIQGVHPGNPEKIREFKEVLLEMLKTAGFDSQRVNKIVLLDVSGSMGDSYKSSSVQRALSGLLDESSIKIFRFNNGLVKGGDWNPGSQSFVSGGTQLGKALDQLVEQIGEEIHRLLIVSDGGHEHPSYRDWNILDVKEITPDELEEMLPWISK